MILAALLLQVTPVAPLPKAVPLPPPDADTAAVLAPIDRLFGAITARDSSVVLANTLTAGHATAVVTMPDGSRAIRSRTWADFAEGIRDAPNRLEERLINPAIEIDGDIAMVWSPYVFLIDGKVAHCGVDHFDMVREPAAAGTNGGWKILNVTWTQRQTDCPSP